jgi:hypothetical protein
MSSWMSSFFNKLFGKTNNVAPPKNIIKQTEAKEVTERMTIKFLEGALFSVYDTERNITYMDKVDEVIRNIRDNEIQSNELMMYLVIGYALGSDIEIEEYFKKFNSFMEIVNSSGIATRKRQRKLNKH